MKAQRIAKTMLSFGLWLAEAQTKEAEPSQLHNQWND